MTLEEAEANIGKRVKYTMLLGGRVHFGFIKKVNRHGFVEVKWDGRLDPSFAPYIERLELVSE